MTCFVSRLSGTTLVKFHSLQGTIKTNTFSDPYQKCLRKPWKFLFFLPTGPSTAKLPDTWCFNKINAGVLVVGGFFVRQNAVGCRSRSPVDRYTRTCFMSLVVMPFVLGVEWTSTFQRLVALSFFSAAQNVMGFYLASPHVQI